MISWLSGKVVAYLVAAAFVFGMGATAATHYWRPKLVDMTAKRDALQKDVVELHGDIDAMGARIADQNAAVDKLREDADERERLARKAVDAALAQARMADTRAQQLLAAQVPQGVDECTAASALIKQELQK